MTSGAAHPRASAADPARPTWLFRYASFVAGSILFLICIGGVVTSKGAGLAVPDWPTSYGYNMFLFPWDRMMHAEGVFWEHSHRLVASGVGLLTVILSVWVWRAQPHRPQLRWLAALASLLVIVQGVLGGLRVEWVKDEIGIVHACLAQIFFALVAGIAFALSPTWSKLGARRLPSSAVLEPRRIAELAVALLAVQLLLGASMRHEHAGLAIPDFPLAYGQIWPDTAPETVAALNAERAAASQPPTSAFQIQLQMVHRIGAFLITAVVAWFVAAVWSRPPIRSVFGLASLVWAGLILAQFALGALTIWTNKAADVATAHVALGSLSLVFAVLFSLAARQLGEASIPARAAAEPSWMPAR